MSGYLERNLFAFNLIRNVSVLPCLLGGDCRTVVVPGEPGLRRGPVETPSDWGGVDVGAVVGDQVRFSIEPFKSFQ